jgi:hypothetical protein
LVVDHDWRRTSIDWVWTLGVALVGVLSLAMGGFDKVTIVIGPFFIFASCLSILRQTGRLRVDVEIPVLVIAAGMLLLIARMPVVPAPKWLTQSQQKGTRDSGE